jgi:hypothetical protein
VEECPLRHCRKQNMRTFPRRLRFLVAPCLTCLLFFARGRAGAQAPVSAALPTVSPGGTELKPALTDEYQKLWSEVLTNARIKAGPRIKNPAISSDGLAPDLARALHEQRKYLEAHRDPSLTQGPVNAATRELIGRNSRRSRPLAKYPCRGPIIRSVNGKKKGVVFTTTAADNRYRIEGCFFGDAPGTVQLELRSALKQPNAIPPIPIRLDSTSLGAWSDRELNVHLDPELKAISDYRVALVIYTANRRRIELRGCRFVAARGKPQLLTVIPSAWVRLYPSGVGSRSIRQLEYISPTEMSSAVPKDATPSSAFVVRSDPEQFGIGADHYDFIQLNPGWVVESVQLQTYSVDCPEVAGVPQSLGRWQVEWTPLGVTIAFKNSLCSLSVPLSATFNISLSQYAIRVWVVGPVGTQPLALVR